jgi:cell division protein FtsW
MNVGLRQLIPFFDPSVQTWSLEARLLRWLTFLWLFVGLVVLFSASYHTGLVESNDGLFYFKRQLLWIGLGLVGFQTFSHLPLQRSLSFAWLGFFGCLLMIFATHLLGVTEMGATRWISIGGFQLQPSEIMKPFLILQSAQIFGNWFRMKLQARLVWLAIFACLLLGILLQPNLSTTALCGISLWLVALAAGLPYFQLSGVAIGGMLAAIASISRNNYQQRRVMSFLNPWTDPMQDGYQLIQSLLAIGSGGLWGKGFGMSSQKLAYLPIHHTDFIFSVYAEEFGLAGCLLLMILLSAYGFIAFRAINRTADPVYRLVGLGAIVLMLLQALINVGVSIGVLPTTGLPFPFFSYGGSSMIASLAIAGLIVRVAREGTQGQVIPIKPQSPANLKSVPDPMTASSDPFGPDIQATPTQSPPSQIKPPKPSALARLFGWANKPGSKMARKRQAAKNRRRNSKPPR